MIALATTPMELQTFSVGPFDLLRSLRRGPSGLLVRASTGKDGQHRVAVPFVTGRLVDLGVNLLETNCGRPRLRPSRRVVDGYLVVDRVRSHTGEAFNQMQVSSGPKKV